MILIIAYGNSLRRDDGAGLVLAEILEQTLRAHHLKVERLSAQQLTPELAADIAGDEVSTVVFVDTRAVLFNENQPRVQIEPLGPGANSPSAGHHLNAPTLLIYAYHLYRKQPPAWQITIPGIDFEHGQQFSQLTQIALNEARPYLAEWLRELPIGHQR